jgi:hypothetical protein
MLADLLNRPTTIVHRVSDEAFDAAYTESTTETVCELQQRVRTEREGVISITDWLLILPAGTPIDTNDQVIVDGKRFEIEGDAWEARNPYTQQPSHVEASLRFIGGEES